MLLLLYEFGGKIDKISALIPVIYSLESYKLRYVLLRVPALKAANIHRTPSFMVASR